MSLYQAFVRHLLVLPTTLLSPLPVNPDDEHHTNTGAPRVVNPKRGTHE